MESRPQLLLYLTSEKKKSLFVVALPPNTDGLKNFFPPPWQENITSEPGFLHFVKYSKELCN